jgi:hypothetical protein
LDVWTLEPGDWVRLPTGTVTGYLEIRAGHDGASLRVSRGEGRLVVFPESGNVINVGREL